MSNFNGKLTASAIERSKRITGRHEEEEHEIPPVQFAYEGDKFIIPEGMTPEDAQEALSRHIQEEAVTVSISETIKAFPLDGALALMNVLKRRYGWTHLQSGGWLPSLIGVEVDFNKRVQVPWGDFSVPKVDGTLSTSYTFDNGMPMFRIAGTVKRRHEKIIASIAEEVREEVKKASIYRAKAIKINFRDSDGNRIEFSPSLAPKFLDLSSLGDGEPIFSKSIEDAIRLNILNPIRHTNRLRKIGASLKKGIVLGGPFDTGKTLTAFQTAKVCVENGWTFLYLEDVRDLDLAINFAKLYQPCVLFAEDADKAMSGPRSSDMDRILNTIDGVESKGDKATLMVLTTNNLDAINRAFLRPGRIDAVINVLPPDVEACVRIVKKYVAEGGCELRGTDEQLQEALKPLVGANAAFFRNTVEQAKLSALEHMTDDNATLVITSSDLGVAAKAMVPHCKLLNPEHGQKSLLDLEDVNTIDPMQLAGELIIQKFAEGFVNQISNPKVLQGVITKQMNSSRGRGGDPSSN